MRTEPFISEDIMKKIIVSALVIVLSCLLFAGCIMEKYEPKVFRCGDLEIELNDGFEKKSSANHDGYFLSKTMGVYVDEWQFDEFDDAEAAAEMTEQEFAEKVVELGKYRANVKRDKGLIAFSYDEELGGNEYTFYSVAIKSDEAFWLVTFFTRSEAFEDQMEVIRDYAWTVEF